MGRWRCSKCGSIISAAYKPLIGNCVKGGNHRWTSYSIDGTPVRWRCGKCGRMTVSANRPMDSPCVKGGMCQWHKE
ncbi:MAG: hypothetical protein LBP19_10700 [Treponema sp.]|jgi:ABC-type ATPase with predicted acetyltransferase domain|nr:hypothetical protein [Treponema sp.]